MTCVPQMQFKAEAEFAQNMKIEEMQDMFQGFWTGGKEEEVSSIEMPPERSKK